MDTIDSTLSYSGLIVDRPTPALGATPVGSSDALPPEVDDDLPFSIQRKPPPEYPGLPERPHKRIKEKFRLDRERLEQTLNAKGDSLYRSKLRPPSPPPQPQGGYLNQFGSGWGNPQATLRPSNPFGWGGGPPQSPFGWGATHAPSMGSEDAAPQASMEYPTTQNEPMASSPMGNYYNQGGSMENSAAHNFFGNYQEVGSHNLTNTSEDIPYVNENYPVEDKFSTDQPSDSSGANEGEFSFGDEIFGRGENPFGENTDRVEDFKDAGYASQNPLPENDSFDFKQEEYNGTDFFGSETNPEEENDLLNNYQMPSDQMENSDQVRLEGNEIANDGTAMTVSGGGGSGDTEVDGLQRPRKQLKEKFMRDREELEAKMNAKGDSIYRRAGDPIPDHLQTGPEPGGMHGGYGAPREGRRFLLPHELRAQRVLQRIARAALMAQARARRKGRRAGPQVIFL